MISQEALIPNIIKTPAKSYFDCITHKAANEYFTDIFKVNRRCKSILIESLSYMYINSL